MIQNQINPKEVIGSDIFNKINISQNFENNIFSIFLNGEDVTSKIRGHKVSLNVSEYAKKPEIRKFVYNLLRKSSELNSIIVDGRDIGTVVFLMQILNFSYSLYLKLGLKDVTER